MAIPLPSQLTINFDNNIIKVAYGSTEVTTSGESLSFSSDTLVDSVFNVTLNENYILDSVVFTPEDNDSTSWGTFKGFTDNTFTIEGGQGGISGTVTLTSKQSGGEPMNNIAVGTNLRNKSITYTLNWSAPDDGGTQHLIFYFENNTTDYIYGVGADGLISDGYLSASGLFSGLGSGTHTIAIPNDKDYIVSTFNTSYISGTYVDINPNIQINVSVNGTTTLATKGTKKR